MKKIFSIGFMLLLTSIFTPLSFAETKPANLTEEQYQRLLLLAQAKNQNNQNYDESTNDDTATTVSTIGAAGVENGRNVNRAQRAVNNTGAKIGAGVHRNGGEARRR